MILDYKKIGLTLQEARKKSNMTLEDVASKLNLTSWYINKIEIAADTCSFELLYSLCSLYNISIEELLGFNSSNRKPKKRFEIDFKIKTEKIFNFKITKE